MGFLAADAPAGPGFGRRLAAGAVMMAKQKGRRGKHIPQRTCIGCRAVVDKRSMIRIVRSPDGVQVDPTGKLAGRGAYLHASRSCWERSLGGSLQHALRTDLTEEEQEEIRAFLATLPEEIPNASRQA